MDDTEIVDLYWRRSEQAIAETAKKYGKYCHIIAYNILDSNEDAEECVNDTWLSAWNSMPDKRPARLNPFLAKITRNFALKKYARRSAQKRGGGETALALEELADCAAPGLDPARALEARELAAAIDRFVSSLSEAERLAFVSRYFFLASEREIAEKLGYSRSGVASMLGRTREGLRAYLIREGLCTIQSV